MHRATTARQCSGGKSSGAPSNLRSTPPFLGGTGDRNPPKPPFSLVPSTARSLFGGTKRECGVGTVGSGRSHALTDRSKYKACGAVLSATPQPHCRHLIRHGCTVPPSPQGEGPTKNHPNIRSGSAEKFIFVSDSDKWPGGCREWGWRPRFSHKRARPRRPSQ